MTGVDWNQVIPVAASLIMSSGVLAQGIAAVKWVARVESRLDALERRR